MTWRELLTIAPVYFGMCVVTALLVVRQEERPIDSDDIWSAAVASIFWPLVLPIALIRLIVNAMIVGAEQGKQSKQKEYDDLHKKIRDQREEIQKWAEMYYSEKAAKDQIIELYNSQKTRKIKTATSQKEGDQYIW